MTTQKKHFFLAIATSLFVLLSIYFLWGFHFQNYERFLNYLVHDIGLKKSSAPILIEANFGILPLLVWLQSCFPEVAVYGTYKLLLICFNLCIISYWCLNRFNTAFGLILFLIVCVIFLDTLLIINSNKLALLFLFSSLFILNLKLAKPTQFILFSLCIVLSLLSRIDLAFMVIGFILFIALIYTHKDGIRNFLPSFMFALFMGVFFVVLVMQNVDGLKEFFTTERAIQDRQDFVLDKSPSDPNLSVEELKIFRLGYFMLDSDHAVDLSSTSIVKHQNLFTYLSQNKSLKTIYLNKLQDLKDEVLVNYKGYLLLCVFSWIFLFYYHYRNKEKRGIFLLATLSFILLPLAINLVAFVELNFFINYLLLPFIFMLLIIGLGQKQGFRIPLFLALLASFALYNFLFFSRPNLEEHIEVNKATEQLYASFSTQTQASEKVVAIANFNDYIYFLPSNPFYKFKEIRLVFLDAGPLNYLHHFKNEFKDNFGEEYASLSHRMQVIEEKRGYLYSSEQTLFFVKNYLSKVSNLEMDLTQIEETKQENFYRYHFSLSIKK